jgi:beta-lactamase superfamily II metal-dependent hydrolase
MRKLLPGLFLLVATSIVGQARNLEVYSIDVEGGQATLIVSPAGESMLIDTGWGGFNKRDALRIVAAAKSAGVKKIDYLLITHYHSDHVGGVPQLAEMIPIVNFVDHGPSVEDSKAAQVLVNGYTAFRDKGKHIEAKPGDTLPIKGIEVKVVTSAGNAIDAPLPGAGQPNPSCDSFQAKDADPTENARSLGVLITYGKFRMLDLGDLTWNKEKDLACPVNKIGPVDLYVVSHHGVAQSGSPQLLRAIQPKVALMNNGAKKGGAPEAWQIIHDTPGVRDIWQIHYSLAGGKDHNAADPFIANVDEICEGKGIRVEAMKDGSFKLVNSRNKYEKSYK